MKYFLFARDNLNNGSLSYYQKKGKFSAFGSVENATKLTLNQAVKLSQRLNKESKFGRVYGSISYGYIPAE